MLGRAGTFSDQRHRSVPATPPPDTENYPLHSIFLLNWKVWSLSPKKALVPPERLFWNFQVAPSSPNPIP